MIFLKHFTVYIKKHNVADYSFIREDTSIVNDIPVFEFTINLMSDKKIINWTRYKDEILQSDPRYPKYYNADSIPDNYTYLIPRSYGKRRLSSVYFESRPVVYNNLSYKIEQVGYYDKETHIRMYILNINRDLSQNALRKYKKRRRIVSSPSIQTNIYVNNERRSTIKARLRL